MRIVAHSNSIPSPPASPWESDTTHTRLASIRPGRRIWNVRARNLQGPAEQRLQRGGLRRQQIVISPPPSIARDCARDDLHHVGTQTEGSTACPADPDSTAVGRFQHQVLRFEPRPRGPPHGRGVARSTLAAGRHGELPLALPAHGLSRSKALTCGIEGVLHRPRHHRCIHRRLPGLAARPERRGVDDAQVGAQGCRLRQ
jgi:hypothetical protein